MGRHSNGLTRRAFMGGAAAFGVLAVMSPTHAAFADSNDTKSKVDAARSDLADMQTKLEQASDNYYKALSDADDAKQAMKDAQDRIDTLQGQIRVVQGKLSQRARTMYRDGTTTYLTCLLGSKTFQEFATDLDMLNKLNQNDVDLVNQSKSLSQQAQNERDEYQHQLDLANQKTQEASDIREQTESSIKDMQARVNELDEQERQELEEENAKRAAEAAQQQYQAQQQQASNDSAGNGNDDNGDAQVSPASYDDSSDDSGAAPASSASGIPTNGSVVDFALSRIGCPYVWGAEGPDAFDCSGLVKWCYEQAGVASLPHYTEAQHDTAKAVIPISECAAGDVLWRPGHVGIAQVDGGSQYIHAPDEGLHVRNTDPLSWSNFIAALRF